MNNDRKFSVSVELLTNKFKQKVQEMKNTAKEMSDTIKKNTTIEFDINVKDYSAQIEVAKEEIESLQATYNRIAHKKPFNGQESQLKQLEAEIEKAIIKYNDLIDKQDKASAGSGNFGKSIKTIDNNLSKATNKIKRYALSILSLRTAYSLVSRASSSYLSTDTERSQKLQNVWASLGAMLTPIIDALTIALQKAVGYINVFVKALTGTDYIKNASKNFEKTAKSVDKLKGSLSGFDEINDIGSSGSDNSGSSNPFGWVEDVQLNDKMVKALQETAKWLKENWNWITKVGEALLIAFGVSKISSIIGNLTNLNNSFLGLNGTIIATGLAITGWAINDAINQIEDLQKSLHNLANRDINVRKEVLENTEDIETSMNNIKVSNTAIKGTLKDQNSILHKILGITDDELKNIISAARENEGGIINLEKRLSLQETSKEQCKEILDVIRQTNETNYELLMQLEPQSEEYEEIYKVIVRTEVGLAEQLATLKEQGLTYDEIDKKLGLEKGKSEEMLKVFNEKITSLKKQGLTYDQINEKLGLEKGKVEEILKIASQDATIKVKADTSSATNTLKNLFASIWNNSSLKKVGEAFSSLGSNLAKYFKVNSYDVGTNYVPNDQLAMIHKGEAVVPKKFNSQEFFGSGNSETNMLLRQLNSTLEQKDMNAYISSQDIGEASISYINDKQRTIGRSVI